jgi:hypothetical protein
MSSDAINTEILTPTEYIQSSVFPYNIYASPYVVTETKQSYSLRIFMEIVVTPII